MYVSPNSKVITIREEIRLAAFYYNKIAYDFNILLLMCNRIF